MSGRRSRQPQRVPYKVAGAAGRDANSRYRAAAKNLTHADCRVFLVVLERTASYSRIEDRVTHRVLAELSGLHAKTVATSLKNLSQYGVIDYEPGLGRRYSVIRLREPQRSDSDSVEQGASTESHEAKGGRQDSYGRSRTDSLQRSDGDSYELEEAPRRTTRRTTQRV